MIRQESTAERHFRQDIREWLAQNIPAELRHLTFRPEPATIMPWYRKLSERGLIAPHWPVSEGGMGASAVEQVILMEELAAAGAPDIPSQGLNHIGPLLIKSGTPAQKAQHLPAILKGDAIWCQGYSEPNSGSDLASLQTRGRVEGKEIIITGHKIWTTWGQHANWMFALVRTGGQRRDGITFVLIDMSTPGISRKPIRTIAGDEEFAEVFLDDVRVPLENVVGSIGQGWKVATSLLDEERLQIGTPLQVNRAFVRLRRLVAAMPAPAQAAWQARLESARVSTETVTAAFLDICERLEAGCARANESSYLKILATNAVHDILDAVQEAAGAWGAIEGPLMDGATRLDVNEMYLQARRLSIYGGSNEIQRTILATRILNMNKGLA